MIGLLMLAEAATSDLPNFKFRDAEAGGTSLGASEFGPCYPINTIPGASTCFSMRRARELRATTQVGGVAVYDLNATYYKARLATVFGDFDADNFDQLRTAFSAKYGEPCGMKVDTFETVLGAKTLNPTATWCFKTGKLKLTQHYKRLGTGRFSYDDNWQPPETPPKIDF